MTKIKVCDRCLKKIRPKVEDYYQVDSYERGKKIKEGYLHKKCNRELEEERKRNAQLMEQLQQMASELPKLLQHDKIIDFEVRP